MEVQVRYSTEFGSTATTMDIEKLPSFTTRFKILSVKPIEEYYTKQDLSEAHQMGAIFAYGRKEATKVDREAHFEEWLNNK